MMNPSLWLRFSRKDGSNVALLVLHYYFRIHDPSCTDEGGGGSCNKMSSDWYNVDCLRKTLKVFGSFIKKMTFQFLKILLLIRDSAVTTE